MITYVSPPVAARSGVVVTIPGRKEGHVVAWFGSHPDTGLVFILVSVLARIEHQAKCLAEFLHRKGRDLDVSEAYLPQTIDQARDEFVAGGACMQALGVLIEDPGFLSQGRNSLRPWRRTEPAMPELRAGRARSRKSS